MRELIQWLMHDEQDGLFEMLVALALTLLFLTLIALMLWPLGGLGLASRLAKGYGVLWLASGRMLFGRLL